MRHYEKGMSSKTGWTMIAAGRDSLMLEIAYRRGFACRQAFIKGYDAGNAQRKEQPIQTQ